MSIPLIVFLALYLAFVFVWLVFSLIAFFHVFRYGQINFTTFLASFLYLAVSALILYWSYFYLSAIDWSLSLNIFSGGADWFGPGQ